MVRCRSWNYFDSGYIRGDALWGWVLLHSVRRLLCHWPNLWRSIQPIVQTTTKNSQSLGKNHSGTGHKPKDRFMELSHRRTIANLPAIWLSRHGLCGNVRWWRLAAIGWHLAPALALSTLPQVTILSSLPSGISSDCTGTRWYGM